MTDIYTAKGWKSVRDGLFKVDVRTYRKYLLVTYTEDASTAPPTHPTGVSVRQRRVYLEEASPL